MLNVVDCCDSVRNKVNPVPVGLKSAVVSKNDDFCVVNCIFLAFFSTGTGATL